MEEDTELEDEDSRYLRYCGVIEHRPAMVVSCCWVFLEVARPRLIDRSCSGNICLWSVRSVGTPCAMAMRI